VRRRRINAQSLSGISSWQVVSASNDSAASKRAQRLLDPRWRKRDRFQLVQLKKERHMRGIIILVLAILILVVVGWIRFDRQPDRSSIHLETQEIKEDTQKAIDQGADLLKETGEAIEPTQPSTTASPEDSPADPTDPAVATEPTVAPPVNP
jgi:cytoskeletal protein RodZ